MVSEYFDEVPLRKHSPAGRTGTVTVEPAQDTGGAVEVATSRHLGLGGLAQAHAAGHASLLTSLQELLHICYTLLL